MPESAQNVYNYEVDQRYEFEVSHNGEIFDTAHILSPCSDERYVQWVKEWNLAAEETGAKEKYTDATSRLWDDLIVDVENIQKTDDWKSKIPVDEKLEAIRVFFAVAIVPAEKTSKVRSFEAAQSRVVRTEAFFNQQVTQQTHTLNPENLDEIRRRYLTIQKRQYKREMIGGLRREPKVEFRPQDDAFGKLYDDLVEQADGFHVVPAQLIPLRFKTTIVHHLFESQVAEKK
jgi:hypothetical protein